MNNMSEILKKYHQEHLLRFYDELNGEEQKHLIDQINSIDFEEINKLYNGVGSKKAIDSITDMPCEETKEIYYQSGLDSIKNGEYAIVTMAGGQGTRLGFDGPKGTYVLEYDINKSLFEIQCDKLKKIYEISNVYCPWYIMTSLANDAATKDFFIEHNYFDYPKDLISFFTQGELPMVSLDGKIIRDSKSNIKMGANGHGGVLSALAESGILKQMETNKIKWIFIGGIDNILLPIDNPDLIGFAKENNYMIASKTITKAYPDEKVGIFCKINGKPNVLEYIDMTPEMNNLKKDDGSLVYGSAHIITNLFNIEILKKIADVKLSYASALKKTDYIDASGNLIEPTEANAYKFETFIFDAFSYVDEMGLLNAKREEIFAPIKNAEGKDSPETASTPYLNYYKNK